MRNFLIFLATLIKPRTLSKLDTQHNKVLDAVDTALEVISDVEAVAGSHASKAQTQISALAETIGEIKSIASAVQNKAATITAVKSTLEGLRQ